MAVEGLGALRSSQRQAWTAGCVTATVHAYQKNSLWLPEESCHSTRKVWGDAGTCAGDRRERTAHHHTYIVERVSALEQDPTGCYKHGLTVLKEAVSAGFSTSSAVEACSARHCILGPSMDPCSGWGSLQLQIMSILNRSQTLKP